MIKAALKTVEPAERRGDGFAPQHFERGRVKHVARDHGPPQHRYARADTPAQTHRGARADDRHRQPSRRGEQHCRRDRGEVRTRRLYALRGIAESHERQPS